MGPRPGRGCLACLFHVVGGGLDNGTYDHEVIHFLYQVGQGQGGPPSRLVGRYVRVQSGPFGRFC